jgi:hypothetical protein
VIALQDEAARTAVSLLVVTSQEASTLAPTDIAARAVSADIAGDAAKAARTGKNAMVRAATMPRRSPVVKERSAPLTKMTLLLLG